MVSNRGKKLKIICSLVIVLAIALMPLSGISDSSAQAAETPEEQEAPMKSEPLEPPPPGTGGIPPLMDLSHLTGRMPERGMAAALPSKWDWRTTGKVSSVKAQGNCGSCYAFASIANIESKMLIDGAGSYDFSENNAKECNWYETSCSGGNYHKLANFFSKKGVVLESCDPYVDSDVECKATCPYEKTLLDWRIINGDAVPNADVLKNYIQTYGPVHTMIYAGDWRDTAWRQEFKDYDGSYTLYYTGTQPPNHCVLIVGWDDSLSHAGGTGGWIVKNSWGTDWGGTCGYGSERGYFTIAYGSASIGMCSSFMYTWQDYDTNGNIMYYDEGGWTGGVGYGSTTAWGLVKFFPTSDTNVTRVEFWTTDKTTDVDVYIYDDFHGTLSNLLCSKLNNSFNEAGYHSVKLDSPLAVYSGNDVIAVVKFTNDVYKYPVPLDSKGPNETGRTYYSSKGDTWTDAGTKRGADVAIRLRTSDTPIGAPTVTTIAATLVEKTSAALNGMVTNDGGEACQYRFEYDTDSGEPYAYNTGWTGSKTSGQSFSAAISSLSKGTKYYFRAQAKNSTGTGSGSELTFLTKPDAPSNFSATAAGTTQIDLSWTKGDGAQKTKIQRKQGGYPLNRNDGTQVYFDTGTSTSDTGLSPGTTYYYRAWSCVQGSEQWSDSYAQASASTGGAGQPNITVSPPSFDVTLPSNTIQNYTLTISNVGDATLTYDITDEDKGGPAAPAGSEESLWRPASIRLEVPLEGGLIEPEESGNFGNGWQNIMTEDFEGSFPGSKWTVSVGTPSFNADAYWGKDNYRAHSGSYSVFCAAEGTDAVDPPAKYPKKMHTRMVYGPFSLVDATDAELSFYHWFDMNPSVPPYDFDQFHYGLSKDGSTFLIFIRDSGSSGGWVKEGRSLTNWGGWGNLCGEPQLWLLFGFSSDSNNERQGSFLDDVVLRKYVGAANNPPDQPSDPSPTNHATGVSILVALSVLVSDPDGDAMTATFYNASDDSVIGTPQTGVASGTRAEVVWSGLAANTTYSWYAKACDTEPLCTQSDTWDFTTGALEDCLWLDENPKSGVVAPGNSDSVTVTINTTGLAEGDYSGEIVIANNDPDENPKIVPVILHVSEDAVGAVATRELPATVEPGANFDVTIEASGCGSMGQVRETLPAGFTYVSCSNPDIAAEVKDSEVWFSFFGDTATFTYTVTAPTVQDTYTFAGRVLDEDSPTTGIDWPVGGDTEIRVWDPWAYDENSDGEIQKIEAIHAVMDYFDGKVTKAQAIQVIILYFG